MSFSSVFRAFTPPLSGQFYIECTSYFENEYSTDPSSSLMYSPWMILSLSYDIMKTLIPSSGLASPHDDSEWLPKLSDLCRRSESCFIQSSLKSLNILSFIELSWSKESVSSSGHKCYGYHLLWVSPTWIPLSITDI